MELYVCQLATTTNNPTTSTPTTSAPTTLEPSSSSPTIIPSAQPTAKNTFEPTDNPTYNPTITNANGEVLIISQTGGYSIIHEHDDTKDIDLTSIALGCIIGLLVLCGLIGFCYYKTKIRYMELRMSSIDKTISDITTPSVDSGTTETGSNSNIRKFKPKLEVVSDSEYEPDPEEIVTTADLNTLEGDICMNDENADEINRNYSDMNGEDNDELYMNVNNDDKITEGYDVTTPVGSDHDGEI